MRNVFVVFLIFSSICFAYGYAGGKAFSSGGTLKIKDNPNTVIDTVENTGFYLEFYPIQQEIVESGLGIKYNSYSEEGTDKSVAYIGTLYGVARFKWDYYNVSPFIQIRGGYPYAFEGSKLKEYKSGSNNDLKGQAYASIGAGIQIFYLDLSFNYEWNTFNYSSDSWVGDRDVSQNTFSINLGFKY